MQRKKRRRAVAPWAAAILLLAVALAVLVGRTVFVVREVQVEGNGDIPAQEIVRLSGIRLGGGMGAVDAGRVADAVENDGRLAFVSLERRLPGKLLLTVRQRTRDALIVQAGKVLVLDSDGYVVEVADRLPGESIPYVTGLKPSGYIQGRQLDTTDGRVACMKAIVEALKAHGATAYAAEINVADVNDLRVITRTGMTVLLGDRENMDNKIIWMAGALSDLEARGETDGRLDVASGSKADYRPGATPEPAQSPVPEAAAEAAETAANAS